MLTYLKLVNLHRDKVIYVSSAKLTIKLFYEHFFVLDNLTQFKFVCGHYFLKLTISLELVNVLSASLMISTALL